MTIFGLWCLMDVFLYVEATPITFCSPSTIRAIKMFHSSHGFSPSSTKHFVFSLR